MELPDALQWLNARLDHETGSVGLAAGTIEGLSLDAMTQLVAVLGDPQTAMPVVHITGTNGKGSVAAMVARLLEAHGLSVGTYTSPHQDRVNERIARNGEPISDAELAEVLSGVAAVEHLLDAAPTWFEVVTAAAFRWFAEAPVDVAVVEVGLLGRFDATNVVDAQVAVVTSIGGDHTDFAPGWERAVASEKAGIITPHCTAVLGEMPDDLAAVFAAEGPAALWRSGIDFGVRVDATAVGGRLLTIDGYFDAYDDVLLPLHGAHQAANAAVAVAATEAFFHRGLDADVVRTGLAAVEVPGRVEVVSHQPLVVLDGAHNPDALEALATTVTAEFTAAGSRVVVLGMLAGRDPVAACGAVASMRPDLVVCTSVDGDRGLPAATLAAAATEAGLPVEVEPDPARAVERVLRHADAEDVVVVTGSFRLLSVARAVARRLEVGFPSGS
ncbi:MAG: bifunctional folylpolyglutamate synthase/dihydrofolate synthase [Actinomycetes bacterium]